MGTASTEYVNWKRLNKAVGCLFARLLSNRPAVDGFSIQEVSVVGAPEKVALRIDRIVKQAVGDPSVASLTIVFLGDLDLQKWWLIAKALGSLSEWSLAHETVCCPVGGEFVAVQITHLLERDDGTSVPSEALFLAPFDVFPNTRRSPHPALELYVGTPRPHDAVSGDPISNANLAHLDARLTSEHAFKKMVKNTNRFRRESLSINEEEDDLRAKARVTFIVPLTFVENEVVSEND